MCCVAVALSNFGRQKESQISVVSLDSGELATNGTESESVEKASVANFAVVCHTLPLPWLGSFVDENHASAINYVSLNAGDV